LTMDAAGSPLAAASWMYFAVIGFRISFQRSYCLGESSMNSTLYVFLDHAMASLTWLSM